MMSPTVEEAFNQHLNTELFSANLYLSMSAHLTTQNLKGMAYWLRVQAHEEQAHVTKFFNFLLDRGGRIKISQIPAPQTEWGSAQEAFQHAYQHECEVSAQINELVNVTIAESDHAASAFLQWFVTEQVEEEAAALTIAEKLKLAGNHAGALFIIDNELGMRTTETTSET